MAKQTGLADAFYIDGHDLSGNITSLDTVSTRKAVIETPTIGKSGMERLAGLGDGEISFTSWFDDGTNLLHDAVSGLPTTDVTAIYCRGTAADSPTAMLVAKQINYDYTRGQDKSLTANVQCLGNGNILEWGILFAAEATQSSAGSTSSKDDSASSANGLAAVLHIIDINSGTPTFKIEDSPNNSDWTDLVSFSAVANGNEPSAERVTVTGTVNRYLRVTSTGTFSNAKFIVAYRRGAAEDDTAY
jgi:hypothetical protein